MTMISIEAIRDETRCLICFGAAPRAARLRPG